MNTEDMIETTPSPKPKRPWTHPRLETLEDIRDTMQNMTQPPNDGSGSPGHPVS